MFKWVLEIFFYNDLNKLKAKAYIDSLNISYDF